jgi:hypothetical protein
MKNIYSKIYPKKLLHLIIRPSDLKKKVTEITKKDKSLQCIAIKMHKGEKILTHKHIKKNYKIENNMRTQESWCVIKGSVIAYFYDVNNKLLCTTTLKPGYASFTFEGGHSLKAVTNNAIVYEYKKGPYKIQLNDKVYF